MADLTPGGCQGQQLGEPSIRDPRLGGESRGNGFGVHVRSGGPAVQRQPLRVELDCVHAAEMVHREAAGLPPGAADVVRAAGRVPGEPGSPCLGPLRDAGRSAGSGSTCMIS